MKTPTTHKTRWHRLLGALLEQLLTPVGISVHCDVKVMTNSPEADILLLRRHSKYWTQAQKQRLADGIRDSTASHILLEFKYSESFNEKAMLQTLAYDFFYKRSHHLADKTVQSFIISSKTPRTAILNAFSYQQTQQTGIYISRQVLSRHVILIVLNELSNKPHNAWIKCFASQKLQKKKAFGVLDVMRLNFMPLAVEYLLIGLWKLWFNHAGEFKMSTEELTPEILMEWGKIFGGSYLARLSPEERLAGLDIEERLAGLDVEERLAGLETEEILSTIDHQQLLAALSVEEIENYLQKFKNHS